MSTEIDDLTILAGKLKQVLVLHNPLNVARFDEMKSLLDTARRKWLQTKSCDCCRHLGTKPLANGFSKRECAHVEYCRIEQNVALNEFRTCGLHSSKVAVAEVLKQ